MVCDQGPDGVAGEVPADFKQKAKKISDLYAVNRLQDTADANDHTVIFAVNDGNGYGAGIVKGLPEEIGCLIATVLMKMKYTDELDTIGTAFGVTTKNHPGRPIGEDSN